MMMTMKMMTTFTHAARNKYGLRCNKYTQYIYIYIYISQKSGVLSGGFGERKPVIFAGLCALASLFGDISGENEGENGINLHKSK